MHVYLKEEPVLLEMRQVDGEGLVPDESGLVPVAFYVVGNERPSFRALLPPETLAVLAEATQRPVHLGLLAEEPEAERDEIRAMVGLSIPASQMPDGEEEEDDDEEHPEGEPWKAGGGAEAWRGEDDDDDDDAARTVLLAFAPLVRLDRRFPGDFSGELADLLESALSGQTRPSLQARVDRMLGDF